MLVSALTEQQVRWLDAIHFSV